MRLTVTDIERSRAFYDAVLGLPVALDLPPDADEEYPRTALLPLRRVDLPARDSLFGLRPVASDRFDEDRVGLDHVSFAVAGLADLERAPRHLDQLGVAHEGIKDIGAGFILELRDPDDIAVELFAPGG
ncbi:VOC family protein [Streptomyces sp. NBUL23]|uniref:VOC family protein n=1 Tax=Streptomyces sp. NBUL23 TaxID=3381354 RepID=UPI0038728FF4